VFQESKLMAPHRAGVQLSRGRRVKNAGITFPKRKKNEIRADFFSKNNSQSPLSAFAEFISAPE
jgi:hypothetical protein